MSATSAPFGFQPVLHPSGQANARVYPIATGYAANIFKGDPVLLAAAGVVQIGATTGDLLGVFNGVKYVNSSGVPTNSNYWPTGITATEIQAFVYDDPAIEYEVQADGSLALTAVGDQANTGTYAGSTSTGMSATPLSSSLAGAGAQAQWRIIGFGADAANAAGDAYTVARVKLARSQFVDNKVAV